ncbi:uncharacterized protein C8Q71DRAFT_861518 [Rhodofomes roseus]|uniref:Uncharacterized protein n=1 Tax=Rhodofomes roseus TaxID=34475 RepID=A0ABQ8K4N4_9APHY|nr:uncharacterized protein C8Q71DRAFT_861518 [Rhodofomes roseus]KAH9831847.1 hypothetical protein C8Q71DRAFT_861518 [Rhodofomes roseus]
MAKTKGTSKPGKTTASAAKENPQPAARKAREKGSPPAGPKRKVEVAWAAKKNHYLTDALLTSIEDRPSIKMALGFAKGDDVTGASKTGGGDSVDTQYERLARELFLNQYPALNKTEAHVPKLGTSVKNRVDSLKKMYRGHRKAIGETGAGLISGDKENEIIPGSELDNMWQQIQTNFPWYKRMDVLMRNHPSVCRDSVANSTTSANTSVLDSSLSNTGTRGHREQSDDESSSDDEDDSSSSDDDEPAHMPVRLASKAPAPSMSAPPQSAQKRKINELFSQVSELAAENRDQRQKMAEMKEMERTKRDVKKAKLKADAELLLDQRMLELQIRLAETQRNGPPAAQPPAWFDPSLQ